MNVMYAARYVRRIRQVRDVFSVCLKDASCYEYNVCCGMSLGCVMLCM
jgi:hypothetical protein